MRKYECNGKIVENAFGVELVDKNGELNKFYALDDNAKTELSLKDLINSQIVEVNSNSGNNSQLATSGNYSQLATSGNYSQLATSGDYSQLATSGDYSQLATSGYNSQLATSGDCSQLATSGDYSQLATSGYNSQLATSGDCSQLATSGNYSKLATSGDYSQLATSGDYSQLATSGNYSKLATSGDCSRLATSGDCSRLATSGDYSQLATSGDCSQLATSGDCSQLDVKGEKSIAFACGCKSTIKAINGTWISLAEYEYGSSSFKPIFALSAQIGNTEYKDCYGKTLCENETYMLINKQFTPIIYEDGITLIKVHSKMQNDMEIIKCRNFNDDVIYCVGRNDIYSHGDTIKSAIEDLIYKEMKNRNIDEVVENIKSTNLVTRNDYRIITGACQFGTEEFCKENNIVDLEEIELDRLLLLLDDKYFGASKFKSLFM